MDDVTNFTFTLQSNLEPDKFAHNTNFEFANSFPHPIDLSGFEVAASSIFLSDQYSKETFLPQRVSPDENKNFFNTLLFDDRILVQSSTRSTLAIEKIHDNYANFIDYLKTAFATQNMHCELIVTFLEGKITKININFDPPTGFQLSIGHPVNSLLGMTTTVLAKGNYEKDIDEAYFDSYFASLADGFLANVMLYSTNTEEITLEQLKGPQTANSVINHILDALLEKDLEATMVLHPDTQSLEYSIEPEKTRVTLSSFLNQYLGLSEDFAFEDSGSVRISPKNLNFQQTDNYLFDDDSKRTSSKILVHCSIIQPQYYGGKYVRLLQLLDRFQRSNVESAYYMNPLVYKDVDTRITSSIQISIKSDQGEYIKYSKTPTVVNLHFRRKFEI